ncbi:MAG: glycosyltransferase family 4 protein [Acidobacteriota bacterium]|nr:glycosyltransferase family 4 protein [Acidobacteriota bacterium]
MRSRKVVESSAPEQNGKACESSPARHISVCMLITNIDSPTGGIQNQSRRLLRGLKERGVSTYVCTRNYFNLSREEVRDGALIHRSPVVGWSVPALNSIIYLIDSLIWLVRNRRHYNVIHCWQAFGSAMVGLLAKKLLGKPVLIRLTLSGETGEVSHVKRMPLARLRLRLLRGTDRWVALTTEMKSEIQSLEVEPERIQVIHNSAILPEEAAFQPRVRERHRRSLGVEFEQVAVFTGRLSEEKGVDTLLRAWRLLEPDLPGAHLLLLGEGGAFRNVESELRSLTAHLRLESVVHFLGHVGNVGDYLLASDLFVLPTKAEGMSNSLVEAMAAGTAIVTTDIPANRDLVEDEVNALLVPPGDVEKLAAALKRVLTTPPLAERIAREARKRAEQDLSVDVMTSKYLALYSSLAARQ